VLFDFITSTEGAREVSCVSQVAGAERQPYGGLGRSPRRDPGTKPLVWGQGIKPPEMKTLWQVDARKRPQIGSLLGHFESIQ